MSKRLLVQFAAFSLTGALAAACGTSSSSSTPVEQSVSSARADGAGGADNDGSAMPAPNVGTESGQATGEGGTVGSISAAAAGAGGASDATSGATAGAGLGADGAPEGSAGTASASPFPTSVTRPKIMIIGDSISAGPGCYKKYLLADLNANGYSNFDFVGAYTDDCGGGVLHSARSCSTAQQYTQANFTLAAGSCNPSGTFDGLAPLAATYHPDLLMMQLGVNDVWGGRDVGAILADYTTLVQQARTENPDMVIVVAQIQQIRPTSDANPDAVFGRAQQLIMAVPSWAQSQSRAESPIFVADLWTNSDSTQTLDGVHPDDAGAQRMGENWFNALKGVLSHD
jgi:GDSL-like lipase/acylhydrolase family protein